MKEKSKNNFEDVLKIDLYSLHTECRDFPNLYYQYAKKFAEASANKYKKEEQLKLFRAEAKIKLEQARASMDLEIRGDPANFQKMFNIKKFTEASINSAIITNPDFISLQEELTHEGKEKTEQVAEAINELEIYRAAMVSLSHKKSGIEDAVKLQLGGFYSEPKTEMKISKKGSSTLKGRREHKERRQNG